MIARTHRPSFCGVAAGKGGTEARACAWSPTCHQRVFLISSSHATHHHQQLLLHAQWEILEMSANAPSPPFRSTPLKGQQHVLNVLDDAVKNGLKVVRAAHAGWPGCAASIIHQGQLQQAPLLPHVMLSPLLLTCHARCCCHQVRAWAHSITKGVELMKSPGVYDDKARAAGSFTSNSSTRLRSAASTRRFLTRRPPFVSFHYLLSSEDAPEHQATRLFSCPVGAPPPTHQPDAGGARLGDGPAPHPRPPRRVGPCRQLVRGAPRYPPPHVRRKQQSSGCPARHTVAGALAVQLHLHF